MSNSTISTFVPDRAMRPIAAAWRGVRHDFWRRCHRQREFIRASERWDEARLAEYQTAQMRALVRHAFDNVPYYRRVFEEIDARPEDFATLEDFRSFPTIDKKTLDENLPALIATNYPESERVYTTTGGSTGIPVGFYYDKRSSLAIEQAFITDQWSRVGYRDSDRTAVIRGTVVGKTRMWRRETRWNRLIVSSYHLAEEHIPLLVSRLRALRPRFIQAYPSSAVLIGRYMLDHSMEPIPGVWAILCGSENLYGWQREILERAFGCRVYSWYGQSERVCLAGECEERHELHIYPQYGITELLDRTGRAVEGPGTLGEIVATGFHTWSCPLIRYRTMDLASVAAGRCPSCARPYARLATVEGRVQEFIVSRSSRPVSMTAINMHTSIFDNVAQFRFVQKVPGEVALKIKPKPTYDPQRDEARIRAELAPKLGSDIVLTELVLVDDIPPTASGKQRFLEQELPVDALGLVQPVR
jgi:phenylacetate-CoA ligase